MIKKANEIIEDFKYYLQNKINNQSDFEMLSTEGYDYSYILNHLDSYKGNYICFLNESGEIINFAHYENEEDLDVITLDSASRQIIEENIDDIKNYYKRPLMSFVEMYDYDDLDIVPIEEKSKIIGKNYHFRDSYYCLKTDKDVLVDKADAFNFPPISIKNTYLTFDILNYDEFIHEKMKNDKLIPTCITDDNGFTVIAGFHYMGPYYNSSNDRILIAKSRDNVVGAIKFGECGNDKYREKHIELCFVDVPEPYRRQGIATRLLEEFGKVIEAENNNKKDKLPIFLSYEPAISKYHIQEVAIEQIKNTMVYRENEHSNYSVYLNGEELSNNSRSFKEFLEQYNDTLER